MAKKKSTKSTRRGFGAVRELPSGRFQASYIGPDMGATDPDAKQRYTAPTTFDKKVDAEGWLSEESKLIDLGVWEPPAVRLEKARKARENNKLTVRDLCKQWLSYGHLKASTVDSHRRRLELRVLCTSLADEPVVGVDRARIALWWAEVQQRWPDTCNTNSFAYKRLHTAFQHAVDEMEVIGTNPVKIKGAGTPPRSDIRDRPAITVSEARDLVDGVSDRMKAPVEVLLYAGLRLGELLALRRKDVLGLDGDGAVTLRVRRDAERVTEHYEDPTTGKPKRRQIMREFDTPKTNAANRDVTLPGPVGNSLRKHCREYVKPGADALIVTTSTSARMMDTSFRSRLTPGKKRAGRNDVGPHDFRRYYGTMLVTNGVDLESARRLMGHETVQQLMEYMRAASGYQRSAADVLARVMKQGADEDQGGDKEQPGAPGNTEKGNPDNE